MRLMPSQRALRGGPCAGDHGLAIGTSFQPGNTVVTSHSVTNWIEQVKVGESSAAQRLWERYLSQLAQVARSRLAGSPQQVADAEDVVVVAFEKFLRDPPQAGRFPRLDDRYDLWQVLLLVTDQVAIDQRRAQSAAKRGGLVTVLF